MVKYFTNRILAQSFGINLAKWKRWSREFLPPDPLGGKQSGYARQYTPDDAFTIYLGGYLVANLCFSIPDARQIIQDLNPWFSHNGFVFNRIDRYKTADEKDKPPTKHHMIFITPILDKENKKTFGYLIRSIISSTSEFQKGLRQIEEQSTETAIPESLFPSMILQNMHPVKLINMTALFSHFNACLSLDPI